MFLLHIEVCNEAVYTLLLTWGSWEIDLASANSYDFEYLSESWKFLVNQTTDYHEVASLIYERDAHLYN